MVRVHPEIRWSGRRWGKSHRLRRQIGWIRVRVLGAQEGHEPGAARIGFGRRRGRGRVRRDGRPRGRLVELVLEEMEVLLRRESLRGRVRQVVEREGPGGRRVGGRGGGVGGRGGWDDGVVGGGPEQLLELELRVLLGIVGVTR